MFDLQRRLSLIHALLLACFCPAIAQAADYETVLTFQHPIDGAGAEVAQIEQVVFRWSTNLTSGSVSTDDLSDLSMALRRAAAAGSCADPDSASCREAYTDVIKADNVVQPLPGAARGGDDALWDFDLDTLTLHQVRNIGFDTVTSTTDRQYLVSDSISLTVDGVLLIQAYTSGVLTSSGTGELLNQVTTAVGPVAAAVTPGCCDAQSFLEAFTHGWQFVAEEDLLVTALGYSDPEQNGLAQPHEVGIFRVADGALLGSVFVDAPLGTDVDGYPTGGINIDFSNQLGTVSSDFAGAGDLPGDWNTITSTGPTALVDVDGVPAGTLDLLPGPSLTGNVPPGGSDVQNLVNDNFFASVADGWEVRITGLQNGVYDVVYYSPSNQLVSTGAFTINGVAVTEIINDEGGTTTLSAGVTHGTQSGVAVINGQLILRDGPASDPFSGLAGLQLVRAGSAASALDGKYRYEPVRLALQAGEAYIVAGADVGDEQDAYALSPFAGTQVDPAVTVAGYLSTPGGELDLPVGVPQLEVAGFSRWPVNFQLEQRPSSFSAGNDQPAEVFFVQGQSFTPQEQGNAGEGVVPPGGSVRLLSFEVDFAPTGEPPPADLYIFTSAQTLEAAANGIGAIATGRHAGGGVYLFDEASVLLETGTRYYAMLPDSYDIYDGPGNQYLGGVDLFPQNGLVQEGFGDFDIGFRATFEALEVINPVADVVVDEDAPPVAINLSNAQLDQFQLNGSDQNQAVHSTRSVGQSFTVGRSGALAAVELSLLEVGAGGDLFIEVLDFTGGDPATAPVLGTVSLTENELGPSPLNLDPDNVTARLIDLSDLNIPVVAGDVLALRLTFTRVLDPPNNLYGLRISLADRYPGGVYFVNDNLAAGLEAAFKVFVSADGVFGGANPVISLASNTNPGLFSSAEIVAGVLELSFASNASGIAELTVLGEIPGGPSSEESFRVTVNAVADAPSLITVDTVGAEDTNIPLGVSASLTDDDAIVVQLGDADFFGFGGTLGVDSLPFLNFDNRNADPAFSDRQIRPAADPRGDDSLNDVGWTHALPPLDQSVESIFLQLGTMGIQDAAGAVDDRLFVNGIEVAGAFDDIDQDLLGSGLVTIALPADVIQQVVADGFLEVFIDGYKIADTADPSIAGFLESYAIDFSRVTITPSDAEVLVVEVQGLPPGALLSAGASLGGGAWSVPGVDAASVQLIPPADFSGQFSLNVTAIARETANGSLASEAGTTNVSVIPVADAPRLVTLANLILPEDSSIGLDLEVTLEDTDGSETLDVVLNVPVGFTVSDGANASLGGGAVDVSSWNIPAIALIPPPDLNGAFALTTTATATENANGAIASSTADTLIVVDPVNDPPIVTGPLADQIVEYDETISVEVGFAFDDIDIVTSGDMLTFSASLSDPSLASIEIAGSTLTLVPAGLPNGEGTATVTVTAQDLFGASVSASFDLTILPPPFRPVISYSPNPNLPGGSNPVEGDFVFFDCNETTGVAEADLNCSWEVTSAAFGTQQASGRVVVFAFPQEDTIDITLSVFDGVDTVPISESVAVDNGAPLVNAIDVEVAAGGVGEAMCRFADPGVQDAHTVTFNLGGADGLDGTLADEENNPSLSSGFSSERFDVDGFAPGAVLNATCSVFDGLATTDDAFTITVVGADDLNAREADDTNSSINAPVVVSGRELVGRLESPDDIDVFELTTAEGLKVGGEFVVNLRVPTDYDLIIFTRNSSAEANSSPFVNAPFVNAPFVNAPFVNVPFVNVPFVNAPFVNAPFVNVPFVNAPFVNAPFVNAPFVNAPLPGSPFVAAGFEFQDFPLSQVGLAAPDGGNISGIDIGLDELGALGSLTQEGLEAAMFSAQNGSKPERVLVRVSPGTQQMYAAVVSSTGAFSNTPYSLRVEASVPPSQEQLIGAQCIRDPLVADPTSAVVELNVQNDPRTLIVTQRERMIATHFNNNGGEFDQFIADLEPFLNSVGGLVISVPGDIYQAADINQCLIDEQNRVTDTIRDIIRARVAGSSIQFIQLMGGADIIPPRYSPDETTVGYEGLYSQDLLLEPGRPIGVAFAEGNNITDAVFGDRQPIPYRGRELYLEDIPVARLVETPEEILAAANNFVSNGGLIPVNRTIATGYDFFKDGTQATAAILNTISATATKELINDAWTGDDLRCGYLENPDGVVAACPVDLPAAAPNVAVINLHATYNAGLSAFGFDNLNSGATAVEIIGANEARMLLEGGLTLSIGCHSGLNVPDAWALPDDIGLPLSPSEDWAQQPGNWIGPWNYGLGDNTVADRGTEGLITLVAEELAKPALDDSGAPLAGPTPGTVLGTTLGDALVNAKRRYAVGLFEFDVHDEKSLIGLALFGMPQARLILPAGAPEPVLPEIPNSVDAGSLSLRVSDSSGGASQLSTFDFLEVTTPDGRFFPLDREAQAVVGRPLLPTALPIEAATVPAGTAQIHDVVIAGGKFEDLPNVDPVIAFPKHDWVTNVEEPRACVETFSPSQLGIATSVSVGDPNVPTVLESLIVLGAQFKCTSPQGAPVAGTLRKYETLDVVAQRPGPGVPTDDFDPPTVLSQKLFANAANNDVTAILDATDENDIREIVALIYTTDADGTRRIASRTTGNVVGTPGPYELLLPNAKGVPVAFQYVDNAGNVLLKSGKGQLLAPLEVSITSDDIVTGPATTVVVEFPSAAELSDPELTVSFGDGTFTGVPLLDENGEPNPGVTFDQAGNATVAVAHDYTSYVDPMVSVTVTARGSGAQGSTAKELDVSLFGVSNLSGRPKSGKISLTWTPAPAAVGYDIYRKINDGQFVLIQDDYFSDYATYLDTDVADGNTYTYYLTWDGGAGLESPDSNQVVVQLTGRRGR